MVLIVEGAPSMVEDRTDHDKTDCARSGVSSRPSRPMTMDDEEEEQESFQGRLPFGKTIVDSMPSTNMSIEERVSDGQEFDFIMSDSNEESHDEVSVEHSHSDKDNKNDNASESFFWDFSPLAQETRSVSNDFHGNATSGRCAIASVPRNTMVNESKDDMVRIFADGGVTNKQNDKSPVKKENSSSPAPLSSDFSSSVHRTTMTPSNAIVIELSDDNDDDDDEQEAQEHKATENKSGGQPTDAQDDVRRRNSDLHNQEKPKSKSVNDTGKDNESKRSSRPVINLFEDENEDDRKDQVEVLSALDQKCIKELQAKLKKCASVIEQQRIDLRQRQETIDDMMEESKIASKIVTLRRQHKTALTALKHSNHENMARLRAATEEKIDNVKAEFENRKETMKKQYNDKLAAKEAAIQKARSTLDVLKQQTKEKLEEAKAKAAEARMQKTQNNAEVEALKKRLREEHAEEMLNCRPENNRRLNERDEQIKDLKAHIRELEKANVKCKADVATLRENLREEFENVEEFKHYGENMAAKYKKYKAIATRLNTDSQAQMARHGEDKAAMVKLAEEKTYQQELKWSVQWNLAQQKSVEVVGLNRIVSELRDGQNRKDAVIEELRRKLRVGVGVAVEEEEEEEGERSNHQEVAVEKGNEEDGEADGDEPRALVGKRKATVHEEKGSKRSKMNSD